jgi:hypothetical protein
MVDPADDIVRQARQGSVSAVIQVLNTRLATSGVRTRAIFDGGVLQLLCEGSRLEFLEQSTLVNQIRQILESIRPRKIRRININARIAREQQLLWLEEIHRDPHHQLLWSEEITLSKQNPLKQWFEDWQTPSSYLDRTAIPKNSLLHRHREQRQFWQGIVGGVGLTTLVLVAGWGLVKWGSFNFAGRSQAAPEEAAPEPTVASDRPTQLATTTLVDPFTQAVRIAEQAALDGQTAASSTDWLDLATRWQRASDLMAQVAPDDSRYQTAKNRIATYSQNSQSALIQANRSRLQPVQPNPTSATP